MDSKSKSQAQNTQQNQGDRASYGSAVRRPCATDAPAGDAELAEVIDVWPTLPAPIRAALLAMIRAK
jgi:hypothetical protein